MIITCNNMNIIAYYHAYVLIYVKYTNLHYIVDLVIAQLTCITAYHHYLDYHNYLAYLNAV